MEHFWIYHSPGQWNVLMFLAYFVIAGAVSCIYRLIYSKEIEPFDYIAGLFWPMSLPLLAGSMLVRGLALIPMIVSWYNKRNHRLTNARIHRHRKDEP